MTQEELRVAIGQQEKVPRLSSELFTYDIWQRGSIHSFGIDHFRTENVHEHAPKFRNNVVGYCPGESLNCRPKINETALMCEYEGERFWFHVRNIEFVKIWCQNVI